MFLKSYITPKHSCQCSLECWGFFLALTSPPLLLTATEEPNSPITWPSKKEFLGGSSAVTVPFSCRSTVSHGDMRSWFIVRFRCSDLPKALTLKYHARGSSAFLFCLAWVWRLSERNLFSSSTWNGEVTSYSGTVL